MITQEQAIKAIQLAIKHLGQGDMVSSARLSLQDAVHNLGQGQWAYALSRATASVTYSVGFYRQKILLDGECSQCHQNTKVASHNFGEGITLDCCQACVSAR